MASRTQAEPTTSEDVATTVENDHGLEFRERHSLTVDPMAHTLLPIEEARRLGAVPLGKEGGRTVIAVADPVESRLNALRELAGPKTKFVLIAPDSLNALLKSRIFAGDTPRAAPTAAVQEAPPAPPPAPEPAAAGPPPTFELEVAAAPAEAAPPPAAAPAPAPAPPPAAQPVYEPQPLPPPRTPAREARRQPPIQEGELAELAAAVAGAADLLLALQDRITSFAAQYEEVQRALEEARQESREHKEEAARVSAKADQERARVKTFASGLSKAFARLEETKAQLHELIDE